MDEHFIQSSPENTIPPTPPRKPQYTTTEPKIPIDVIVETLERFSGLVNHAAKSLGIAPETLRNYARLYPQIRVAIDSAKGRNNEIGYVKLMEEVKAGNFPAIKFLLSSPQAQELGFFTSPNDIDANRPQVDIDILRKKLYARFTRTTIVTETVTETVEVES